MKFSYIAVLNGVEIRQECTYHTCEVQKDGGKKYQASDTEQSYDIDLLDRYWDNVPTLD